MPQVLRASTAASLALLLSAAVGCQLGQVAAGPASALGALNSYGFPTVPIAPAPGYLFSDYKAPMNDDYEGQAAGSSTGMSEAFYIGLPPGIAGSNPLPLIGMGDASLAAAAQNGGLSQVNHADYEVFNVLTIFTRFRVHAHGN